MGKTGKGAFLPPSPPPPILNRVKAIGSSDKGSSKTQPGYVTWECCFIFISLFFTFSFRALLILRLLKKTIGLVLSSLKSTLNLLSTNQSQLFSKSCLSCFSISLISVEDKNRFDLIFSH